MSDQGHRDDRGQRTPITRTTPQTVHVVDLWHAREQILANSGGTYPWMQIGVFPVKEEDTSSWFNYTVGLSTYEVVIPCYSIEGRGAGNDLIAEVINAIGVGIVSGLLAPGDTLNFPFGIPGDDGEWERDADVFFWLRDSLDDARRHGVFQSPARYCLPVVWSSPQGWPDE